VLRSSEGLGDAIGANGNLDRTYRCDRCYRRSSVSGWQRWIDTALESPEDIMGPAVAPLVPGKQYRVMPRSFAALFVRIEARSGPTIEPEEAS
jgi:hypothetical protein